jgi:hypothetical protein
MAPMTGTHDLAQTYKQEIPMRFMIKTLAATAALAAGLATAQAQSSSVENTSQLSQFNQLPASSVVSQAPAPRADRTDTTSFRNTNQIPAINPAAGTASGN